MAFLLYLLDYLLLLEGSVLKVKVVDTWEKWFKNEKLRKKTSALTKLEETF